VAWDISATIAAFDEAIAFFRDRVPLTDDEWNALTEAAHAKAFKVAGLSDLDLVTQVWEAIGKAIEEGSTFDDFKAAIGDKVKAAWAGTVDNPAWRLETIFRTNTQGAYGAGRYKQMMDPAVLKFRPFWLFDSIDDHRRSPICNGIAKELNGQALPADSEFCQSHVCPLHHSCRSGWRSIRKSEAEKRGIADKAPDVEADAGFGKPPGVDDWEPDVSNHPAELRSKFKKKQKSPPESTV
jgi:hypothetical protein